MGNVILNNIKLPAKKKEVGLNISELSIPMENIVAVVGAKDCGKTDFLNVLCGKVHPANGTVTLEDGALGKGDLAFVDAETYQPAFLTVKELIDKTEKEYPNFSREVAEKYINAMQIPMEKIRYRNFHRRVQCAINCILAIASRAKITVFDQPCRNMHLKLRDMLYKFAKEDFLEVKRTFFITSNIALDIDEVATYVVYLRNKSVVFNLPYEEVDKFSVGLIGKEDVIRSNIGGSEVFYKAEKEDGLVHMVVQNNMSLDSQQALALSGVISQYVNLVNFHTYVVKQDFGFDEKAKLRAELEKLQEEKREEKLEKQAKKKGKNVAIVAKDDVTSTVSSQKVQENKETFMEKLKRIMTTPL